MYETDRIFIVTGGPGAGKTTLIEALASHGLRCMPEAGRAIIRHQQAIGGCALPWEDRRAFAELMLGWELRSWHEAHGHHGPVLFDRGLPNLAGYLALCGLEIPDHLRRVIAAFRYNRQVFIAPPWPAIFGQDAERRQSFAEAEATHHAMVRAYAEHGNTLTPLPLVPVAGRVGFVLDRIGKAGYPA